jgi:hypothetical protein
MIFNAKPAYRTVGFLSGFRFGSDACLLLPPAKIRLAAHERVSVS